MEMETLTLASSVSHDLIASLKSAFHDSDLSGVERILCSWVESLKSEISKSLSDELFLMAVEKSELEFRVSRLEKEIDLVKKENVSLVEKVSTLSEIMEEFKKGVAFESTKEGGLEIRLLNLENKMKLVEKENVALKEKVVALSKIAEESRQRQSGFEEKRCRGEKYFANKTPLKRAFRAPCSDSDSESGGGDENLGVKDLGSRKRRLIRVGEIEGHGVSGSPFTENFTVRDEPGPDNEVRGSGFTKIRDTSANEKCKMDDFSDVEGYGRCEMNESDSSGSPVARKMSSRERNRQLNYPDTEEEKDESEASECRDKVNGSKYVGSQPTAKVVPEKMYINLDNSGSEEETDTESDSLGGFIVSGSEPECDNPTPSLSEEESDDATLGDLLKKIKREKKKNSGEKWEYEADMLADFGKHPELCLNAVCALHRQQTEEEQEIKSTFVLNGRGFGQVDAHRYVIFFFSNR